MTFKILSDDDIKKLKVDGLKKEICLCGLLHEGRKVELVLQKAIVDKVPILNIYHTSVGSNGFAEKSKQRLREVSEEVEEPKCLDPTLVAPSLAINKKNYIDLNDYDDKHDKTHENKTKTKPVKKQNHEHEIFNVVVLQLIPNKARKKSTIKKVKRI